MLDDFLSLKINVHRDVTRTYNDESKLLSKFEYIYFHEQTKEKLTIPKKSPFIVYIRIHDYVLRERKERRRRPSLTMIVISRSKNHHFNFSLTAWERRGGKGAEGGAKETRACSRKSSLRSKILAATVNADSSQIPRTRDPSWSRL